MKAVAMPYRNRERGLTLLEIMVALAIGAFMLIGIISLVVSVSQSRVELSKTSGKIENGRYAIQLISDDLALAGFYGRYSLGRINTYTLPDVCADAASLGFGFTSPDEVPTAVDGVAAGDTLPACYTSARPGSEAIAIRRMATTPEAPVNGRAFFQSSNCDDQPGPRFILSTDASVFDRQMRDCVTAAPTWRYVPRAYYLSACNECANDGDGIPTLNMAEMVGGSIQRTALVEGIEDMHFQYGLDADNNGSPDCFVANPDDAPPAFANCPAGWATTTSAEDINERWRNVVAVRVSLLVRSIEPTAGWNDDRAYDLGRLDANGATVRVGPFNDNFRRRAFSTTVMMPNVAGVRER